MQGQQNGRMLEKQRQTTMNQADLARLLGQENPPREAGRQAPKPKGRRRPSKRFFAIIIAIGLIYTGYVVMNQELEMDKLRKTKAEMQLQVDAVKAREDETLRQIDNAQTQEYQEDVARDKLGLVKPGEIKFLEQK